MMNNKVFFQIIWGMLLVAAGVGVFFPDSAGHAEN